MIATKRLTLGLPDDVAAYLAGLPDASAAVAAAVRARIRSEAILTARWRERLRPMNLDQRVRILRRRRQLLEETEDPDPGQGTRA